MMTEHQVGAAMAASALGIDRRGLINRCARQAVMDSEEGTPFKRELCKIAAALFEVAGDSHAPAAILFRNLSKEARWYPSYNRFTDCVLRALARNSEALDEAAAEIQKAAAILPAAAALHDKVGGGVMKTLAAGGALGGASLGALAFLMARNAQQSSAENEVLLQRVRAYRQLKREIEEDMAAEMAAEKRTASEPRYDV